MMDQQPNIIPDTVMMDQQPNIIPAVRRTIVDLKAKKRVRSVDDYIRHPQEKIPTLQKNKLPYREGTQKDILALLNAETPLENEGVFLKNKIPPDDGSYTEKILANGGFSKCIHLYESPEKSYICKEVEAKNFHKNEVINMCQLNDENICQIYGLVRKTDEFHIYMEYCGLNLLEWIKGVSFDFNTILQITKQLCMAAEFAHNNKIIHLDIKPENICLLATSSKFILKLTDWGSSNKKDLSTEIQGVTYVYASPEILYLHICKFMMRYQLEDELLTEAMELTQKFCRNYDSITHVSTKSDSFSIGLTIIYTQTKEHLYERQNKKADLFYLLKMFAENPDAAKNLLTDYDDILTDIVKKLIEGDSRKRISVKDVQKMIRDYEQNPDYRVAIKQDINQDTNQSDTNMADTENEEYNIPNLDMLF